MKLKRRRIDSSQEKRIITGMIVSKEFLEEIHPLIDLSYFQSTFTEIVAEWVLDFYEAYNEVPLKHIKDIFESKKETLKDEDAEIIAKLLTNISDTYEADEKINVDYYVDQTEKYFKRRELEITASNLKVLLEDGDLEQAEKQIEKFRKVQKLTSNWINPFDNDEINKTFAEVDEEFFKFPGALGEFLKNMDRGWLVGITGPFKRGKTFFGQEFGVMGIFAGLRVAFFSLEMAEKQMKIRIYKRLTAAADTEGAFKYPMFDCLYNQDDTCEKANRTNDIKLLDEDGAYPQFDPESKYKPCTYCRGDKSGDYFPATWFELIDRPAFNVVNVGSELDAFQRRFHNKYRMKVYPRFTANVQDIMRDLDVLEHTEGFIPDIVIVDYADILKPEDSATVGVEKEDRTWIALAQLAAERSVLVVAPTQATKEAMEAQQVTSKHTAKWIGKLGHVDGMLALNQTEEEKLQGVMRISWMVHRHEEFHENASCMVLQNLKLGQANLDSEMQQWRSNE